MGKLRENFLVLCICLLISSVMVLFLAEMPHWDFQAFHHYNGWAFLNWRYDVDTLPTLFRTYFNPLVDALSYLLLTKLNFSSLVYGLVDNLWYCAFIFVSYLIFKLVFKGDTKESKYLIIVCFLLTIFSPILLLIQRFWCAMPQNIFMLISLYLFLASLNQENELKSNISFFISGVLAGFATGLKYTFLPFAIGIIICMLTNRKYLKNFANSLLLMLVGMFIGFMAGGGWWIYYVYNRFHNPVYPYLNNIFNPGAGDVSTILKQDFLSIKPKNFWGYLFYPLYNSREILYVGFEENWFDLKVPAVYISVIAYWILNKFKNFQTIISEIISARLFNTIVLFTAIVWVINLLLFGAIRYLVALIPFVVIIIAGVCYIVSKLTDTAEKLPNIFLVTSILVVCYYFNSFANLADFSRFLNVVFFLSVVLILAFCIKYHKYVTNKGFLLSMFLFFILFLSSALYPVNTVRLAPYINEKVLVVEDVHIEDDSAVFLSMLSTFIVPFQNPRAEYIGLTIPSEHASVSQTRNNHVNYVFQNKMLEKKIEKTLAQKKNVYFIFNDGFVKPEVYANYFDYYSKGKINNLDLKRCKPIRYTLYGSQNKKALLCKIK